MTIDAIANGAIFALSIASIVLVAKKNRWGFVFGLLTQPFWFITSYVHGQWGIFFVSIAYTASWCFGIYEWFFKKPKRN